MTIAATIIAGSEQDGFRIVKQEQGDKVTYIVELPDGNDALGCERWKDVSADGKVVKAMRDFIIRAALQQQQKG
jgi:hypothetical protein